MISLRENRAAFSRLRLLPRMLVDVTEIETRQTILGYEVFRLLNSSKYIIVQEGI